MVIFRREPLTWALNAGGVWKKSRLLINISLWGDWWSVECCQQISTVEYVDNSKLGGPQPAQSPPRCTKIAHLSTASVPTSYYPMWHYNCLWKGLMLLLYVLCMFSCLKQYNYNCLHDELIDLRGATRRIDASTDHQRATVDAACVQWCRWFYSWKGDGSRQRHTSHPVGSLRPAQRPDDKPTVRGQHEPGASRVRPPETARRRRRRSASEGSRGKGLDGSVRDQMAREKSTRRFVVSLNSQ